MIKKIMNILNKNSSKVSKENNIDEPEDIDILKDSEIPIEKQVYYYIFISYKNGLYKNKSDAIAIKTYDNVNKIKDITSLSTTIDPIEAYDINRNIFKTQKLTVSIFDHYSFFNEITEQQYKDILKNTICDCELGKGNNIQADSNPYTNSELFEKIKVKFPELDIKLESRKFTEAPLMYDERFIFKDKYEISLSKKYYKKACLICGKCLDEISLVYNEVKDEVKQLQTIIDKDKIIRDICGE